MSEARSENEPVAEREFHQLIDQHRRRLSRVVQLRLDARVRARIDSSDIVQEVMIEAARRYANREDQEIHPCFLWLRSLAIERIIMSHRKHLGAKCRTVHLEQPICEPDLNSASHELSLHFAAKNRTPSSEAAQRELQSCVRKTLESLEAVDREIILLRHFEQLDNRETATVLGLNPSTASSRYLRAVAKLRKELERVPGFF